VATEHLRSAELEAAVERARARAARTGELRPIVGGSFAVSVSVSDELAEFVQRILTDGTYAHAVGRIGEEDPDLANI
jgi:hypothetical protein